MINSPTLSVSSSAPKATKAPAASAATGTQQSFGSAFEIANQAAQNKPKASEKNHSNQSSKDINQDDHAVKGDSIKETPREPDASHTQARDTDEPTASDTDSKAQKHEENTEISAKRSSSTDEKSSKALEDGKELQADGQNLAVDQAATPPSPEAEKGEQELVSEQESVSEQAPLSAEEELPSSALVAKSGKQPVETESDVQGVAATADSEPSATTPSMPEQLTLNGSDEPLSDETVKAEEAVLNPPVDGEVEQGHTLAAQDPQAEAVKASEEIESVTVSVNGANVQGSRTPPETSGTAHASQLTPEGGVPGVGASTAKSNEANPVVAGATLESQALNQVAQTVTTEEGGADLDNKAHDNLRWVMEQMSKKTEQAGTGSPLSLAAQGNVELSETEVLSNLVDGELVLDSDKIELPKDISDMLGGKKTLDQLMANLGSQLQSSPNAAQAQTPSAFSAVPTAAAAARPEGAAAQLTMQSLPNSATFAAEMATKVSWASKEGLKTAHIHLDPPELGSLTVKISVDHESNAHVSFVASSAQARDALEGQMQRLREMLQQQGVELDSVDVEVSQGNDQAFSSGQSAEDNGADGRGTGVGSGDELLDGDELENVGYVLPEEQGIDYYA
ncbi:Flagellar hook-length control protein FliK [Marinomonas aquimarina]|uniref:Flagellar hook-length control protein FliK n=1 Tax=Marinomonas aquimarina TaxID=295068 RepID=A0A1A8T088_9GAMM|nr:flagellar hook-length control protein FliK [Marinomonas aquimarina]SBS24933.1 Flagellar hook-length control protein FliK [Marinomonas aquimarina]